MFAAWLHPINTDDSEVYAHVRHLSRPVRKLHVPTQHGVSEIDAHEIQ